MEQEEAYSHLIGHDNCFLTGCAGVGKSWLLNRVINDVGTNSALAVCATTGIAARNIRGSTVHSFLGIGMGRKSEDGRMEDFEKFWRKCQFSPYFNRTAISQCEVLIIDEISMMTGTFLNDIDEILKRVKKSEEPFGGVKIVCCGDALQLPPVTKGASVHDWFFKSKAWKAANIKTLYLHKNYRQTDPEWLSCLNDVRVAKISPQTERTLRTREVSSYPENFEGTFLMSHNEQVRNYNSKKLAELPGQQKDYNAICTGKDYKIEQLFQTLTTPRILQLKLDAKVMATVNHRDGAYFNGSLGIVKRMSPEEITVLFEDGMECMVTRFRFTDENRNVEGGKSGGTVVRQFPLKLAYACSIHQAQGITISKCFIEATHVFQSHQLYVALSRCKTLEGLTIKGFDKSKCWCDLEARKFYDKILNQEELCQK